MTDFPSKTPASSSRIVVAKSGTSGNGKAGTVEGCPAPPSRRSDRFPLPSRPYRTRRLFAVSAALLMVFVVFAVIPRDVRAGTVQPLAQPLASQSVTYGPGWERIVNPDGTVEMHQLPTFQRWDRSEEHTSELQSRPHLVCRLLLEKKKHNNEYDKAIGAYFAGLRTKTQAVADVGAVEHELAYLVELSLDRVSALPYCENTQ